MNWLIPPARPNFQAALRDVRARTEQSRLAAAERLSEPDAGHRGEAVEGLLALLEDSSWQVRREALRALGGLEEARALKAVVARLEDEHAAVRENAVIAACQIGGQEAMGALRQALRNPHPEVRFQAIECCSELCPGSLTGEIAHLARDDDPRVRANAASALGWLGREHGLNRRQKEGLRETLADADPSVRLEGALALARLKDGAGLQLLRRALSSPAYVLDALEAIAELRDAESADLVAALAGGFFQPLMVKAASARTLIIMRDSRGTEILRKLLASRRGGARGYGVQIAGELAASQPEISRPALCALAPELERLARRPRGIDLRLLTGCLASIAPDSPGALKGLRALASLSGDDGQDAREELKKMGLT